MGERTQIYKVTSRGAVKVDQYLRTTAKDIWAMGDVRGGLQFTYISLDDYRIIKSQIIHGLRERSIANPIDVPFSVFIDPAYSRVGLNEKEAKEKGYRIQIATLKARLQKFQRLRFY